MNDVVSTSRAPSLISNDSLPVVIPAVLPPKVRTRSWPRKEITTASAALAVGLFWLLIWQLWTEARPRVTLMRADDGTAFLRPPDATRTPTDDPEVVVIEEKRMPPGV